MFGDAVVTNQNQCRANSLELPRVFTASRVSVSAPMCVSDLPKRPRFQSKGRFPLSCHLGITRYLFGGNPFIELLYFTNCSGVIRRDYNELRRCTCTWLHMRSIYMSSPLPPPPLVPPPRPRGKIRSRKTQDMSFPVCAVTCVCCCAVLEHVKLTADQKEEIFLSGPARAS